MRVRRRATKGAASDASRVRRVIYLAFVEIDVPGGPAVHTINMLKGFSDIGVDCTLICPRPNCAVPAIDGVDYRFIPFFGWSRLRLLIASLSALVLIISEIIRRRPDALYYRDHHYHQLASLLARLVGLPLVLEFNGRRDDEFAPIPRGVRGGVVRARRVLRRAQLRAATGITFNSTRSRDDYCDHYGIAREMTRVITMRVDGDHFYPRDRDACRDAIGLPRSAFVLGYCGTFHPNHGLDEILDVFRYLRDRAIDCRFLLVGGGLLHEEFLSRLQTAGLRDRLILTGWVEHDRIPLFVGAMDLGIAFLRRDQAFAIEAQVKLKEYVSCGVPALVNAEPEYHREYPDGAVWVLDRPVVDCEGLLEQLVERSLVNRLRTPKGAEFVRRRFGVASAALDTIELVDCAEKPLVRATA